MDVYNLYDDLESKGFKIYNLTEIRNKINGLVNLLNEDGPNRIWLFADKTKRELRGGFLPVIDLFSNWNEEFYFDNKRRVFVGVEKEVQIIPFTNLKIRIDPLENGEIGIITKHNKPLGAQISPGHAYARILEY
ncbi:MAG: hypothetical protein KC589_05950 [Nanoarchaeota archaeon]|nr:hypothetical protein [Nanoarchaeota archaeon]